MWVAGTPPTTRWVSTGPINTTSLTYKWATPTWITVMPSCWIISLSEPTPPLSVYALRMDHAGLLRLAKDKIKDGPLVVSGPDVGNWDSNNVATQQQENQAIVESVKACMDECDGYFLFDMIHLKMANQWQYAKQGIDIAIGK